MDWIVVWLLVILCLVALNIVKRPRDPDAWAFGVVVFLWMTSFLVGYEYVFELRRAGFGCPP